MDATNAADVTAAASVLSTLGLPVWGDEDSMQPMDFCFPDAGMDINELLYKDVSLPELPDLPVLDLPELPDLPVLDLPELDLPELDLPDLPELLDVAVALPPPVREKVVTHSRKRKHEVANTHVPRKQRCRSTFSYKFKTVEEEVYYRLYKPDADAKSAKLNALVRTCFERFGETYVPWDTIKAVAAEVGYSPKNNMFRTIWALTVSRYGRNSDGVQNNEVFGLNFPYWTAQERQDESPRKRGSMLLRLSPEFFAYSPPVLV